MTFHDISEFSMTEVKQFPQGSIKTITYLTYFPVFAFVKERIHNAVEIDILGIFGRVFIVTNSSLPPLPPKNSLGANSLGANDVIAIDHVLCLSHVFLHLSACLFVEFDLLQSFNYSSSGENQPIDENKNETKSACRQS